MHRYIKADSDEEFNFIEEIAEAPWFTEDVETATRNLEDAIRRAWDTHSKTPATGNYNIWWNNECQEAKDTLESNPNQNNRNRYKATLKKAKNDFYQKRLTEMSQSQKPWEAVKWTRARKPPPFSSICNSQGHPLSSTDELWEVLHNQFNRASIHQTDHTILDGVPALPERDTPDFSEYEVLEAIATCSNSSAPGPDHLQWRHIKLLTQREAFLAHLIQLYNNILNTGVWPTYFKKSISVVIPKPKKNDYSTAKAHRPIALLNTLGKLFTKAMARRLQFECIKHQVLYEGQMGGIAEHATLDAGMYLMNFLTDARARGLTPSLLTFDIAQFFPSINHELLLETLRHYGFSNKIVSFFASFFKDRYTQYAWGATLSPPFPADAGVPQGDCLSPIISAILLSVAYKRIHNRLPLCSISISFVDDGNFAVASTSTVDNVLTLRKLYKKMEKLTEQLGLRIEPDKTELIHFFPWNPHSRNHLDKEIRQAPMHLPNGSWIQPKAVVRYLGFYFNNKLMFQFHVKYYTNKAFSSVLSFRLLGNSMRGLSPSVRALVYKAIALPIMTYGLPLWYDATNRSSNPHVCKLQAVQNKALRFIMGAFITTPIGAMEIISGLPPMKIVAQCICQRAAVHMKVLNEHHIMHKCFIQPSPLRAHALLKPSKSPTVMVSSFLTYLAVRCTLNPTVLVVV
ncbi:hypothetical protein AX17_005467 [Amanita inopinata Kibby_2008]|nr:hypothetical protein AX17_005467 [Amanita inopinata Kibby_2008]